MFGIVNNDVWTCLAAMAEGNGEVIDGKSDIKDDQDSNIDRTADYPKLLAYGLDKKVAAKLDDIYKTGEISFKVCNILFSLRRIYN